MSVADIVSRTDVIYKKYEKYTVDKPERLERSQDPFIDEFQGLVTRINELTLKADEIASQKNRAQKASMNAELRRAKAAMTEQDVPKLEKLVKKGKKVTPQIIADRQSKVQLIKDAIAEVPDGVHGPRKPTKPLALNAAAAAGAAMHIDLKGAPSGKMANNPAYYQHSDETRKLATDWQIAKAKQDQHLDNIEKGLSTLKGIGESMGEALKTQDVLLDTIDAKMDNVVKDLKTNNMKLKGLVTAMRSPRNFCIDIALICIALSIGLYLFLQFKK